MKSCPVIVIGHVDHGKTSLVGALTGIETDRLPEEKARGLSITSGFAYLKGGDANIDLVDAPGHQNFIRAMVGGAAGARSAALVVSAAEGVEAQTLEHIAVIETLGIHAGIVVLSKADLVAPSERPGRKVALQAALAGTAFRDAPLIFCSAVTGEGLEDIAAALRGLAALPAGAGPAGAFLAIDRVFVAEGHGTVVTGTLLGRSLKPADELLLAPSGEIVTIRRIEVRGETVSMAQPGERTALNLRGVAASKIKPGDVVHAADAGAASLNLDAAISVSARAGRPVRHMEEIRVLYGTGNGVATLRLLGRKEVSPGETGFAQLRFTAPAAAFAGQRAVLRSLSPSQTLGGAIILDPAATPLTASKALRLATLEAAYRGDTLALAAALAAEQGGVARLGDVCRLARAPEASVRASLGEAFTQIADGFVSPAAVVAEARDAYLARLCAYHAEHRLRPQAPRSEILAGHVSLLLNLHVEESLAAAGVIRLSGGGVALAIHDAAANLTPDQTARMHGLARQLQADGLTPSGTAALIRSPEDAELLELLVERGEVIRLSNVSLKQTIWLHAEAVSSAIQMLRTGFPGETAFTTGEAREALKTSRKHIVPLLEYLDAAGITQRQGDTRCMV
ncbi:selenocysteine-specific translation elongation factor [Hyphomonas neptunium ATCC 15444]|uniref:Selenocysteine-specific translation elongation factor n=2 Tax=Hyphomonas TaxID=85 RepID=Q0BZB1_HYPNA|nr:MULTISPECIES: selenocysteine-specific translation elongation factor [Hyphomonas]ABI76610.1 selenocysteine-specific translation elongation factor [Hyphomonas neptunium ATCC 15444]KCZ95272.1 selenocysteine-specific translation elongation factor [Hyphomonas hirschiana VP5]